MLNRIFLLGLLAECVLCQPLAFAGELHRKAVPSVSPSDELEILDPRVDPEGKPKALMAASPDGTQQIEIPPTIIVHRYYYTGDRDFQGPMLKGGPTVITAQNPATGEQSYVEVLLPPGAPRIHYRRDRIVYEFRTESVIVRFGHPGLFGMGKLARPTVAITHHSPVAKDAVKHLEQKHKDANDWFERSGIPEAATTVTKTGQQVVSSSADTFQTVGSRVTAPVVAAWKATPLSSITSTGQVKQPKFEAPNFR
ncbi:MAG: hypothetical protein U0941_31130 [Planctomycetaceae bacterium]